MSDLRESDPEELGIIMNARQSMGHLIKKYISYLPSIDVVHSIKPVA